MYKLYIDRSWVQVWMCSFHIYNFALSCYDLSRLLSRLSQITDMSKHSICNAKTLVTTDILNKITENMGNFWQKYGKKYGRKSTIYGKKYGKIW